MKLAIVALALLGCSKKPGTASCVDLMACYAKCDGLATACTNACDDTGTAAAKSANASVFACIASSGCKDEDCMRQSCGAQLAACTAAVATPASPAGEQHAGAVADEDFIFVGDNGLSLVPALEIVAHGVAVTFEGTWKDSRHNLTFELAGSTYRLQNDEAAMGTGGAGHIETGTWTSTDATLVLTPQHVTLNATSGVYGNHQTTDDIAPDAPRTWNVEGVTLEWTNFGPNKSVHRNEGLVISGPGPSWSSLSTWQTTLRRAR